MYLPGNYIFDGSSRSRECSAFFVFNTRKWVIIFEIPAARGVDGTVPINCGRTFMENWSGNGSTGASGFTVTFASGIKRTTASANSCEEAVTPTQIETVKTRMNKSNEMWSILVNMVNGDI